MSFLCATKKTKGIFRTSKAKICTLFFCGTAARQPLPSSGRKVSRESVTKGARGTSNQQKAAVLRLRQFSQSLKTSNSRRDFALSELIHFLFQNFCNNFKFEKFECLAFSFSRLRRQLPLGGTSVCACFFSVRKGKILQNFGKYQKRFSESHRTHFCGDLMRHCGSLTS